jgi:hypothetical protein
MNPAKTVQPIRLPGPYLAIWTAETTKSELHNRAT